MQYEHQGNKIRTETKRDWLREPSKWCLQFACKKLCENLFSFKKLGRGFPKFKKKGRGTESIHITENPKLNYEDWSCKIAKVGKVRILKGHNKQIPKDAKIFHYSVEYKTVLDRVFLSVAYKLSNPTNLNLSPFFNKSNRLSKHIREAFRLGRFSCFPR